MAEDKILAPPVEVGADLGEKPSLEGKRNTTNSPELFPSLEIGSYLFLYKIASIAVSLEERLSLQLTPKKQQRLFTPPTIRRIGDVVERLVLLKPDNEEELKAESGSKQPLPRDYQLARLSCQRQSIAEKKEVKDFISRLQIDFSLPRKFNYPEVSVIFHPRTKTRFYREDGSQIDFLNGLTKDEVRDLLSTKRFSSSEVAQIIDSQKRQNPSLEVRTGSSCLKIEFYDGFADCQLSAGRKKKRSVQQKIPLSEFTRGGGVLDFSSQASIDKWLVNIAGDLFSKIKG